MTDMADRYGEEGREQEGEGIGQGVEGRRGRGKEEGSKIRHSTDMKYLPHAQKSTIS